MDAHLFLGSENPRPHTYFFSYTATELVEDFMEVRSAEH